ncbi:MAG TPA: hypothetical protein PLK30_10055, partial [Blastocatellia bacterium]|nr:hypothetical protein [Blastocatellia bacterium]
MEVNAVSKLVDTLAVKERLELALAPKTLASGQADSEADDKIRLLDYWRSVRKRLWLIVGIAAL